ncbi:MAG: TlpA family protein disulfide reductase [Actinobacteria bacterium]|nr:TlpA family protein disulfide reductase [Actinomycetota bacterium]
MKHRSAVIAGVVGVAVAALVVVFATADPQVDPSTSSRSPLIGKLAPPLAGTTADGGRFDLDKRRGEWVLVNFFATWCPPCVQEQPELVRLADRTAGHLQIVSVAAGDTAANVTRFFSEQGGNWPVLVSDTDAASIDYGLIKLPESYLISPEGIVVEKFAGGVTAGQVEARIAELSGTSTTMGGGS